MIKNRETLITAIKAYDTRADNAFGQNNGDETKAAFLDLLHHKDSFQRTHLPGHITGSAWIVNRDLTKSLLILHAKLGRWLQPGGHADGEEDVLDVALREVREETGLQDFIKIIPEIFDLDIHEIPARKDFPAHLHYDIRFVIIADESSNLIISDESNDLKWIEFSTLPALTENNPSILRMLNKTLNFIEVKSINHPITISTNH